MITPNEEFRDDIVKAFDDLGWGFEARDEYHQADRFIQKLDAAGVQFVRQSGYTGVLVRDDDETGVSGTGPVAWIVEFPDGVAVTRWAVTGVRQTCVWESIDHVIQIHGHDGRTRPVWSNSGDLGADWPPASDKAGSATTEET